jgi:hypothetical protein
MCESSKDRRSAPVTNPRIAHRDRSLRAANVTSERLFVNNVGPEYAFAKRPVT